MKISRNTDTLANYLVIFNKKKFIRSPLNMQPIYKNDKYADYDFLKASQHIILIFFPCEINRKNIF